MRWWILTYLLLTRSQPSFPCTEDSVVFSYVQEVFRSSFRLLNRESLPATKVLRCVDFVFIAALSSLVPRYLMARKPHRLLLGPPLVLWGH